MLFDSLGNKIDIYPVGSIYLSVNSVNPGAIFGGEWEQIAKGRTLVGIDPNDPDFSNPKKTGGSKELAAHNHTLFGNTSVNQSNGSGYYHLPSLIEGYATGDRKDIYTNSLRTNITGQGDSGNLQPYFTCYIWCRIS